MSEQAKALGEELKPCPFCGQQPGRSNTKAWCTTIQCGVCDRAMSHDDWNTRATQEAQSLPELPEPKYTVYGLVPPFKEYRYTADQMRAYGELCRKGKP